MGVTIIPTQGRKGIVQLALGHKGRHGIGIVSSIARFSEGYSRWQGTAQFFGLARSSCGISGWQNAQVAHTVGSRGGHADRTGQGHFTGRRTRPTTEWRRRECRNVGSVFHFFRHTHHRGWHWQLLFLVVSFLFWMATSGSSSSILLLRVVNLLGLVHLKQRTSKGNLRHR